MVADTVYKVNQPVSYVCNKCYYITKDIKDIEKHSKNWMYVMIVNLSNRVMLIIHKINNYVKKIKD